MTKRKTETVNDLSRCLDPLDMDATLIAVIEMSQSSWLVAGIIPGVERQPLKKIVIDEHALLKLLSSWRKEAEKKGHKITRVTVAFEAGHDGFWLARRLSAFGIEVHVIHPSKRKAVRLFRRRERAPVSGRNPRSIGVGQSLFKDMLIASWRISNFAARTRG